jgi:hypothetical protein
MGLHGKNGLVAQLRVATLNISRSHSPEILQHLLELKCCLWQCIGRDLWSHDVSRQTTDECPNTDQTSRLESKTLPMYENVRHCPTTATNHLWSSMARPFLVKHGPTTATNHMVKHGPTIYSQAMFFHWPVVGHTQHMQSEQINRETIHYHFDLTVNKRQQIQSKQKGGVSDTPPSCFN